MGALEDFINKIEKESGKHVAFWQLCNIKSSFYHKYGRYPSKDELLQYGDSIIGGSSSYLPSTHSKEAMEVLNSSESSEEPVKVHSFNKAYKIWK